MSAATMSTDTLGKAPPAHTAAAMDMHKAPPNGNYNRYNMYYTTSMLNVTVHAGKSTDPVAYYCESKSMTLHPRLFLRREPVTGGGQAGATKKSPMVAFVKGEKMGASRTMIMGLGDCEAKSPASEPTFEELRREKTTIHRSDYHFSTDVEDGIRREFAWRKDYSRGAASKFDCVDADGRVLARMLSGGASNWKKAGELYVLQDIEQDMADLLVVSSIAIWAIEGLAYQSIVKAY